MIGKIPDTKIKITIKPGTENDGYPWVARSGTKPKIIAGGPTAQEALEKFVSVLAEQEEIPLSQIGWDVIGVQAIAALYINRENRTLTEFGPAAEAPGTSELVCTVTEEDYYDEADEPTEDEEIELPGKTCAKCWYFHFPIGNLPSRCNRYGTPASADDIVCDYDKNACSAYPCIRNRVGNSFLRCPHESCYRFSKDQQYESQNDADNQKEKNCSADRLSRPFRIPASDIVCQKYGDTGSKSCYYKCHKVDYAASS